MVNHSFRFTIITNPEATHASQTILIGFADMFLPSILIESAHSDLTRFVIGALSITQLIYLSEVGGVILGSKIPVNIGKLFVIFLIRTIITLPIITLIAHLFYNIKAKMTYLLL